MISPHTPPGTRVVCIDDGEHDAYTPPGFRVVGDLDGLTLGTIYTVKAIVPFFECLIVELCEINRTPRRGTTCNGFALQRFRRLDLPKCLTDLLNTTPVDSDVVDSSLSHQHPDAGEPPRQYAPVDCSCLRVLSAGAPS